MTSIRARALTTALIASATSCVAAQRTFEDGDFAAIVWGFEVLRSPADNGASADRSARTDGNPDACLRHDAGVDADAGDVVAVVSRFGADFATRYETAVSGAIVAIDFSFDVRAPGVASPSARCALAIKQGSVIYAASPAPLPAGSAWEARAGIALVAADFSRIDGLAGHPDFSTSSLPIRFCFASILTSAGSPEFSSVDLDNFYLRAWTACPADLDDGSGAGTPDQGVDINDLLFFLNGFELGDTRIDLDDGSGRGTPDGGVDVNDLLFFLGRFERGC